MSAAAARRTAKSLVCAIDQGTSSTRCMLFDKAGAVVASAQREHTQHYPQEGWVEHDPAEIWARTQEVCAAALASADADAAAVSAVGITNQRESTVVWNKRTGAAYHNVVVWNDTRTNAIAARVAAGDKDRLRAKTGLPLVSYFSATKLAWLLENVAGLRDAAASGDAIFGTIDTWLTWNLTGGAAAGASPLHITDVSNASRTLLMNLETCDWDDELLATFDVPRSMLPSIVSSSAVYGTVTASALSGAPLAGILGDQQAATFGQACYAPGEAKCTYGTGAFIMMNTGTTVMPSEKGLLTTVGWKLGDAPTVYALEGSVAYAGSLVQWLRDNLGLFKDAQECEALARSVDDHGGMFIVPAFAGLFAPYWRADARAAIVGLTAYNTKAHFARAAIDAAAYQVNEVLAAMRDDSGGAVGLTDLKVDGGMTVNELLMQFQADLCDVAVTRPVIPETTALGAAYAAGLATGFFADTDELKAKWKADKTWKPDMPREKAGKLAKDWAKAVTRTFDWAGEE